ncbi:MAG TPA: EamA family transporter [Patescibacteria group bacterium]|nr:EamA family transporter [bacterium]HRT11152.1 EamA family transporter [Patescibacteria group bacterium]
MWLLITIIANLLNGVVYLVDKYFLSQKVHSSVSYAFYVGIWSIGNCVFFIFNRHIPTFGWLLLDLLAGLIFMAALYFWYKALHQGETTKVVPIAGSFIPFFTLLLNFLIGRHNLTSQELLALIILIAGTAFVSFNPRDNLWHKWWIKIKKFLQPHKASLRSTGRLLFNALLASFIFATYYVMIKYIYDSQGFSNSFVWTRLGSFLGALLLLIPSRNRKLIFARPRRQATIKSWPLFLGIRLTAFIAFAMTNFAISLADVSLVNSLQGLQYIFLLIIAFFLAKRYPKLLKQEINRRNIWHKLAGIILINIGLFLLL